MKYTNEQFDDLFEDEYADYFTSEFAISDEDLLSKYDYEEEEEEEEEEEYDD